MDKITITLTRNDLGQLIDGLDVLIDQWNATTEYLNDGTIREDVCLREVHSANESHKIASHYQRIRDNLVSQC